MTCIKNPSYKKKGAGWQLQNISPYIISWVGLIEQSFSIYFLVLVKRFVKAGGPSPLNAVPLGISAVRHSISSGFLQSGINNNYSQHIYSDIEDPARP